MDAEVLARPHARTQGGDAVVAVASAAAMRRELETPASAGRKSPELRYGSEEHALHASSRPASGAVGSWDESSPPCSQPGSGRQEERERQSPARLVNEPESGHGRREYDKPWRRDGGSPVADKGGGGMGFGRANALAAVLLAGFGAANEEGPMSSGVTPEEWPSALMAVGKLRGSTTVESIRSLLPEVDQETLREAMRAKKGKVRLVPRAIATQGPASMEAPSPSPTLATLRHALNNGGR